MENHDWPSAEKYREDLARFRDKQAVSALPTPEPQGQSARSSLATGSLPAPSAVDPIDECGRLGNELHEVRSALREASALLAYLHGAFGDKLNDANRARLKKAHAAARALAHPKSRQPEENTKDEPHGREMTL